jgi:hypothetical protein
MPKRAWQVPSKVAVRPVTRRVRTAIGAGLLLVALGAAACSPNSSLSGRSLPISVTPSNQNVHPSQCTLNSSGTQAVATGTFSPPAALPVVNGEQTGALHLQLQVMTTQSVLGHHDVGIGGTYVGVSVGQTSWRVATTVYRIPGVRATRCAVTFGAFDF